jgi:hypothetical protein
VPVELLLQILLRQRNAQKGSNGNFEGSVAHRAGGFGRGLADPFGHSQIAFGRQGVLQSVADLDSWRNRVVVT